MITSKEKVMNSRGSGGTRRVGGRDKSQNGINTVLMYEILKN